MLFDKLRREFNFESSAITLIRDYLSDRSQTVCIDGEFSAILPLLKGVPQGTILGPMLFSLFINSLPEAVKYVLYHIFADDVQIYKSFKPEDSVRS